MKTDFYTKAVLTVIAVCLVVIVLRDISFVTPAKADSLPGPAAACLYEDVVNVRIVEMPRVEVRAPFGGFEVDVRDMPGLDIDRMPSISVR
ncbi:MAG: hypothetical protein K2L06_07170 [Alistipes sp.]|nr:hypothetical protein [Alistipes sp.]